MLHLTEADDKYGTADSTCRRCSLATGRKPKRPVADAVRAAVALHRKYLSDLLELLRRLGGSVGPGRGPDGEHPGTAAGPFDPGDEQSMCLFRTSGRFASAPQRCHDFPTEYWKRDGADQQKSQYDADHDSRHVDP